MYTVWFLEDSKWVAQDDLGFPPEVMQRRKLIAQRLRESGRKPGTYKIRQTG